MQSEARLSSRPTALAVFRLITSSMVPDMSATKKVPADGLSALVEASVGGLMAHNRH
jgi:hypothetical protein